MHGHRAHVWMCGAMIVAALAVLLLTADGLAFAPILGCILMMVVMMWMMGGMGNHDRESRQ